MQGLLIRASARRAPAYTGTVLAAFAWEDWDWLRHDAPKSEVYDARSCASRGVSLACGEPDRW